MHPFTEHMNSTVNEEFQVTCQILGSTHFVITKLPSEKIVMNHIFAIAFNGIMIIPTILLNGVAVVTIFKSSQLNSKPCYFIVLLQSMFDLAVGVFSIPLFIYYLANSIGGIFNCFAASLGHRLTLVPVGVSTITMTAMSMERYIAILHPYAYKTQVTKKRLSVFIGSSAAVEFLVLSLSLAGQWLLEIYVIVKITLVFLFTIYVYTKIYLVVKKLARSQKKPHDFAKELNLTKLKLFLRQIKEARSCFLVVVCFCVLGFLPATIAVPFFASMNKFEELAITVWVISVGILNSSVNSIIFFWTKTMLRKEALKVFKAR